MDQCNLNLVKRKIIFFSYLYLCSELLISSELIFILDNIKRKRIKTGGNPMNILREIQQLEQNQMQSNMSNCKFFLLLLFFFIYFIHNIPSIIFSKKVSG